MRAPVGNTCPNIDQCIKWLKICRDNIDYCLYTLDPDSESSSRIESALIEAKMYCDIDKELEELRDANSALRDWGYELANELEKLKSEL